MATASTSTSIVRNTVTLVGFAILASAIVALAWVGTKQRIEDNRQAARMTRFAAVLGDMEFDALEIDDTAVIASPHTLPGDAPVPFVTVRHQTTVVAWVFIVTAKGYSGPIDLMVGVTPDARISGVRVITHSETPGLGDDIERSKSDWIESFNGMNWQGDNDPRWALKRSGGEFDGFTGASITPRAVIRAVGQTVRWVKNHRDALPHGDTP